jgi:transposase-like zinc-binding protein
MAPALEVADIFRRHGEAFRQAHAGHLGCVERRVMGAITACRTAVLGGHVEQYDDCGATRIACNPCRNRHCPKCQGLARAQWLAQRQPELLPAPYFHVVFTLPAPVGEIAFQNKAAVYAILLRAAGGTLATIAADPRRLGAQLGVTMVLHTWGQTLQHHPPCPLRRAERTTGCSSRTSTERLRIEIELPRICSAIRSDCWP